MTQNECTSWLYLFSSNTKTLYAVDVLRAIASPEGWTLHYRYESELVDPQLRAILVSSTTPSDKPTIINTSVVISFVHEEKDVSDPTGYKPVAVYPIRLGKLISAFMDGDVAHFYFAVYQSFKYEVTDIPASMLHTKALDEALGNNNPDHNIYAALGKPYSIAPARPEEEVAAFQSVVSAISGEGFEVDKTVFARFNGIRKLDTKNLDQQTILTKRTIIPKQSGYVFSDTGIYSLDISTFHVRKSNKTCPKNAAFEINLDPTLFVPLGSTRIPITGPYDRISFPIAVAQQSQNRWTFITVKVVKNDTTSISEQEEVDQSPEPTGSDWAIPVLVEVDRVRTYAFRLLAAVSEIMIAVGTALTASLSVLQGTGNNWVIAAITLAATGVALRVLVQPKP
jgi:hypothetical protein